MYERILVVVETEPAASAAVAEGLALARSHAAELVFLAARPHLPLPVAEFPMMDVESSELFLREAARQTESDLADARALADGAGIRSQVTSVPDGDDAASIVEAAARFGCDLIVVESTGRNAVARLLGGSVIPGLITRSTVPLLIVRHAQHGTDASTRVGAAAKVTPEDKGTTDR